MGQIEKGGKVEENINNQASSGAVTNPVTKLQAGDSWTVTDGREGRGNRPCLHADMTPHSVRKNNGPDYVH